MMGFFSCCFLSHPPGSCLCDRPCAMSFQRTIQSLIDFVRNPENEDEVRLLYHKVIAPAKGVLGWAGGESLAFDLVFTGAETLSAVDVQALVKASGSLRRNRTSSRWLCVFFLHVTPVAPSTQVDFASVFVGTRCCVFLCSVMLRSKLVVQLSWILSGFTWCEDSFER